MPDVLHFYLDDSGTRHPDHKQGHAAAHGCDYFGLGGILINEEDEDGWRELYAQFCADWDITYPIHSVEVRSRSGNFHWLKDIEDRRRLEFYEGLYGLLARAPVVGLACVIDRPGYNARYREKYGRERWSLCKTSFTVAVERAAKYAKAHGRRLRVMPERCNKPEDAKLLGYYNDLKTKGMPFAGDTSEKYGPLTKEDFQAVLYEFRLKKKSSPLAQLADLYLWPLCMGGYHESNHTYSRLKEDGKLIECVLPPERHPTEATKYSCFEGVARKP